MVNSCFEASAGAETLLSPNEPKAPAESRQQVLKDIRLSGRRPLKPVSADVIAEACTAKPTASTVFKHTVSRSSPVSPAISVASEQTTLTGESRFLPVRQGKRTMSVMFDESPGTKKATERGAVDELVRIAQDLVHDCANWMPGRTQTKEGDVLFEDKAKKLDSRPTVVSIATQGRQSLPPLDEDKSSSSKLQRKTPLQSFWCCSNTGKAESAEASIKAYKKEMERIKHAKKGSIVSEKSSNTVANKLAALMESSSVSISATPQSSSMRDDKRKHVASLSRRSTGILDFVDMESLQDFVADASEENRAVSRFFRLHDDLDARGESDEESGDVLNADGDCKRTITVEIPEDSLSPPLGTWSPESSIASPSASGATITESKKSGRVTLGEKVTRNTDAFAPQKASTLALKLRRRESQGSRFRFCIPNRGTSQDAKTRKKGEHHECEHA